MGSQFKFVNEIDLQKAIAKVRRERTKLKEQEIWSEFCSKELQKLNIQDDDGHTKNETSSSQFHKNTYNDVDYMNEMRSFSPMKKTSDPNFKDELCLKLDKKLSSHKETSLSYSNVTSISLPCSDSEFTIQSKLQEVEKKTKFMCSKILNVMEVIESNLSNFRVPETSAEILQYHRKASEFCIRFSRNHFYQIESQFNLLISIDNNVCQNSVTRIGKLIYLQKNLKLFQTLLLGYYTFYRHMYIVWGYNGIAEKLQSLLNITQKILNTVNSFQGIKEIPLLNELKSIVQRMLEITNHLIGCKHSSSHTSISLSQKVSTDTRRVKSANSSIKFHSGKSTNSDHIYINKRRVQSANSADPYYMYQNKELAKNGLNCKLCNLKGENHDKPNSDVFKRLSTTSKMSLKQNKQFLSNKENKYSCYRNVYAKRNSNLSKNVNDFDKNYCKQTKCFQETNEVQLITNNILQKNNNQKAPKRGVSTVDTKCNNDKNECKKLPIQQENDEALVKRLIPLIADHFRGVYENVTIKEKSMTSGENETKVKSRNSSKIGQHKETAAVENMQVMIMAHDSETLKSPNSPLHYFHDSAIKQLLIDYNADELKSLNDSKPKKGLKHSSSIPSETRQTKEQCPADKSEQIIKISDDLIANELSSITMEIDTPLKQFIKNELSDFSDFLYKTHSIEK